MRRHRLAERFLTDILGLSWADAHREAGKWEHVMSDDVEQAMDRVLGGPTTCPHGNPIPGSDYHAPDASRLVDVEVGTTAEDARRRLAEHLERLDASIARFEERLALSTVPRIAVLK